ncbi:hypothetical protein D3C86_1098120 [compost metagenome]
MSSPGFGVTLPARTFPKRTAFDAGSWWKPVPLMLTKAPGAPIDGVKLERTKVG